MQATDFEMLRAIASDCAGLVLEKDQMYLAETRLAPVARGHGLDSVGELVARLRASRDRALERRVAEALTTNETSFFRDHSVFEALRIAVLPRLLERRGTQPVAIWCAAASSGQEPFSIAILVLEHFPGAQVHIVASDLSRVMLERADRGVYSEFELTRGMPRPLMRKYFTPVDGGWRVRCEIRRMVEFRDINLVEPWPPLPMFDVILLRNVLIYFDSATKQEVLVRASRQLRTDGTLVLGASENMLGLTAPYRRTTRFRANFYHHTGTR
jgi:chemotaxis protein methyltransferase CheR